ncbi:uncharacterized protein LOC127444521 isoform X3 [Myxocyprinus asiaticus]|uniref:uncharacterized protein LOC127444521 isoform X2 n=1 Tax=Myxocyprinus asiaticus TaxID=70543 RepID=UPI00222367D3|nr:uncharacterized protein LOC127444521 isoform X2 [Myxocyprinus asiaticus]XP_051559876.1 uncharacterized protein LOC127444521 isoform X3 [Myxocyprinus asiaticus]
MTRAGAIRLSIIFILTFILCLPEFFPNISQIPFLCEPFDPCTPENGSVDAQVCGPPCTKVITNASSQDRHGEGWYLCQVEMDLHDLLNNTLQSGEHVMMELTLKAGNLSAWSVSVFAFLNHTDLYTGPQKDQRLFYCYNPPDKSICPDLNISTEEPTKEYSSPPRPNTSTLITITSTKPVTSSLKNTTLSLQVTTSTHELNCRPYSSVYLFYYQEHNQTARSSAFPVTHTKRESWWCVITAVWLILVVTLVVLALLSVGCLISKSRHLYQRRSPLVSVRDYQLKELSKKSENSMSNIPDVSIAMSSFGDDDYDDDDDDVFSEIPSKENRSDENLLRVDEVLYKRRLSPIFEMTETSLDEEDHEEVGQCNALVIKQVLSDGKHLYI